MTIAANIYLKFHIEAGVGGRIFLPTSTPTPTPNPTPQPCSELLSALSLEVGTMRQNLH
jgi:hypothetical protein